MKSSKPTELIKNLTISLDVEGIVKFHRKLGPNQDWGNYYSPFLANHYFKLTVDDVLLDGVLTICPSTEVQVTVIANGKEFVQTEHIQFLLVGGIELTPGHTKTNFGRK